MKKFGTLALISIGFIAGITFVYSCGGAGSSSAAAVQTGYLSIGYEGFHAGDPTDLYNDYASLSLPHNSRIKSITGYFTDTHILGSNTLTFRTYNRNGTIANSQYISTVNISGYGSETISFPGGLVIDNFNYYYSFKWPSSHPPEFAFYSVFVEYEYDI